MQDKGPAATTLAKASFILGLLSVTSLIGSLLLTWQVTAIGLVEFFAPIMLLALAAILLGFIARHQNDRSRLGKIGRVLGIATLLAILLMRVAVFIFFLPWLFA